MFKVFDMSNVEETINKNPIICYCSTCGACGPSGLCVVYFDDGTAYGYNLSYDNQELYKKIIECVPELGPGGFGSAYHSDEPIEFKRAGHVTDMNCVGLGLGNFAYLKEPLHKQYESLKQAFKMDRYLIFRMLIASLGYINVFQMFNIVEKQLKGNNEG